MEINQAAVVTLTLERRRRLSRPAEESSRCEPGEHAPLRQLPIVDIGLGADLNALNVDAARVKAAAVDQFVPTQVKDLDLQVSSGRRLEVIRYDKIGSWCRQPGLAPAYGHSISELV